MAKELTIPQRLEWLLIKRGVSQNALARVSKVSPQTVANTLRHGRVPQSKTTLKWARTLGVPGTVFTAKRLNDDALAKIVAGAGAWKFAESTTKTTTAKKTTAKATTRKPVAKKVVKKAVAKKTTAKKTTAKATTRKPVAKKVVKKAVAKKTTAKATTRKPVAKKIVKKAVAKKPALKKAVAKKPVAKKVVAKKVTARPAAKRTTTAKSKAPARTAKRGSAVRKSVATRPVRGGHIDVDAIISRLQTLSKSRKEEVAVAACGHLISLSMGK